MSKGAETIGTPDAPLGDRTDMVYMNTNVTRGAGDFVVTATGMQTEVGHISDLLQREDDAKTPLTRHSTSSRSRSSSSPGSPSSSRSP